MKTWKRKAKKDFLMKKWREQQDRMAIPAIAAFWVTIAGVQDDCL